MIAGYADRYMKYTLIRYWKTITGFIKPTGEGKDVVSGASS